MIWLDKRVERCLGYSEKPLSLYRKLRDSEQNPVFLIKHVKDIPSPSVVARRRVALDPFSARRQKVMRISSKHRDDPELRAQELLNALGDALVPLSYAVAIFPYLAEYEDEFDVAMYVFIWMSISSLLNLLITEVTCLSFFRERQDGGLSCVTLMVLGR